MMKTNGTLWSTKERARFAAERIMMSHFSFLKMPVLILLKNTIPSRTETVVGIQMPKMLRMKEGRPIAFMKIMLIANAKTAAE